MTDIATNFAKNFALQASEKGATVIVYDKIVDPWLIDDATREANEVLQAYYADTCGNLSKLPLSKELAAAGEKPEDAKKALADTLQYCRRLALSGAADAVATQLIKAKVGGEHARPVNAIATYDEAAKNCLTGVCYRPLVPIEVELSVRGGFKRSDMFLVPDVNTVLFVDLVGGVFATQKYTLDFTDGVLTSYKQDGQTEVLGLVSLPLTVLKAVAAVPGEMLGLKKSRLEAETQYLTAVAAAEAKKKELGDLCKDPNSCPKTAYKIIGGPVKAKAKSGSSEDVSVSEESEEENGEEENNVPVADDTGQ